MLGPQISRPFPPLNLRPGIFISSRFPWILCMIVQRSGAEKKNVRSLLTFMNRSSIPPTPPYSHAPPPPPPRSAVAGHHSRSISQPAFFSLESLPPLTPVPYPKSSPTSSLSDSGDMPAPFSSPTVGVASPASAGLPPRKAHRRSTSDIPSGFFPTAPATVKREPGYDGAGERKSHGNVGDDMFDAFLHLEGIGAVESSDYRREEMDSRGSGNSKNCAYSSESEAESSAIECGGPIGEAARSTAPSRHFRSISMDGLMRSLSFDEESNRVPPSPGSKRRQSSHDDPMDGEFSLEFGNGEFSGTELKKIMSDKRLEEIALADPKRAKRILANRQSAARSKERKTRYISELERKVQTLQTEATTMSAQLTLLQRDSAGLATQNSELKIRLQAMEQQAQLRDALNEALSTEVHRLRLATAELDDSRPTQMKPATSIK